MKAASYQTITLSRGKHKSPEDGACVMELASMLAGEPFGDHPVCVCPVIGALLRRYNDTVDDAGRQDLYAYAAKIVGSRASGEVESFRSERIREWALDLRRRRGRTWWRLPQRWSALSHWHGPPDPEFDAARAIREVARHRNGIHREVLAVIDELMAIPARAHAEAMQSLSGEVTSTGSRDPAIPGRRGGRLPGNRGASQVASG